MITALLARLMFTCLTVGVGIAAISTPLVLAQISEVTAASDGLTKGGMAFVATVLAFTVWALYREVREWQGKYIALVESSGKEQRAMIEKHSAEKERHNVEMLTLLKETMPIAAKMADGVRGLERITDHFVKD